MKVAPSIHRIGGQKHPSVDGWVEGGSTSVGVVGDETSSTVGILRVAPPGFNVIGLPTTTCTFTPSFAPQLGTITVEVSFTPVG